MRRPSQLRRTPRDRGFALWAKQARAAAIARRDTKPANVIEPAEPANITAPT